MARNGEGESVSESENLSKTQEGQGKGMADLILKLAKEIIQIKRGMMVLFVPPISSLPSLFIPVKWFLIFRRYRFCPDRLP